MEKQTSFALWVSLISNLLLTTLKIIFGFIFHSQVLIADGVHNAGDVVAVITAYISTKIARQPADEDHPYGHGKAEVIASGWVGIILGLSAIVIAYQSILSLFHPASEVHMITFIVALFSVLLKQSLYIYCIRVGKRTNSKSLIATAYDHLADVYASIAAMLGIGLALIGVQQDLEILKYGDPISGIIVSILVFKLAVHIGSESTHILMEKNLEEERIEEYIQTVSTIPEVCRVDRLRAREHGHYIVMDIRVSIPATLSIQQGHDISKKIKQTIMNQDESVQEVLVHLNPFYEK
ncbi:MAG TPA: cation diffusion facilitator family transporter [Bacillota bacterium]|nr:cation diffusion facilitator family transporter [Bacillota bacterium]